MALENQPIFPSKPSFIPGPPISSDVNTLQQETAPQILDILEHPDAISQLRTMLTQVEPGTSLDYSDQKQRLVVTHCSDHSYEFRLSHRQYPKASHQVQLRKQRQRGSTSEAYQATAHFKFPTLTPQETDYKDAQKFMVECLHHAPNDLHLYIPQLNVVVDKDTSAYEQFASILNTTTSYGAALESFWFHQDLVGHGYHLTAYDSSKDSSTLHVIYTHGQPAS